MTTRDLQQIADGLATPVEDGLLVRAYVTTDAQGRWTVCWGMDQARRKVHIGPAFEKPADASRLCRILNERIEQQLVAP
jgi:hypothetical protein